MKKLLLASRGTYITDGKCNFFSKPKDKLRWAYIMTASKSVPDRTYIVKHERRMRELGWDFETVDLDGKNSNALRKILRDRDAINMEGGNAYYLLKSIRESGFGEVLKEFLERGGIYCGASAGSYVVCPTIETATWKNPHKFDRHGVTDFTALNLVPFLILAHVTPEVAERVKPAVEQARYPVKLLTDQQAVEVVGDQVTLLEDLTLETKDFGG